MLSSPDFRFSDALHCAEVTTGPSAPTQDVGNGAHAAPEGMGPAEDTRENTLGPGAEIPASSNRRGSFNYDRTHGILPLEWPNIAAFHVWCRNEELAHSIELISSTTSHGGQVWTLRRIYVLLPP
jgi:hypothetical protein